MRKDHPNKKVKNIDARRIKKNFQDYYDYKNQEKVNSKSKLIDTYVVTDASVYDSQTIDELFSEKDKSQELFANGAYIGQEEVLINNQVINRIHEKGYRNKPLTAQQKSKYKEKSKTRVRVEHVFGFMENSMG